MLELAHVETMSRRVRARVRRPTSSGIQLHERLLGLRASRSGKEIVASKAFVPVAERAHGAQAALVAPKPLSEVWCAWL